MEPGKLKRFFMALALLLGCLFLMDTTFLRGYAQSITPGSLTHSRCLSHVHP